MLGFEQEETEEDFYLLAKSLASKTAESLEEATHIELKDNQVTHSIKIHFWAAKKIKPEKFTDDVMLIVDRGFM